ncbi:Piwi domain-containing protein [Spirosoma koreense]
MTGFYVGRANSSRNPDVKPRFATVGKVIGIEDGDLLQLDDLRPGEDTPLQASKLFLEPREDVLTHCIKHLYGTQSTHILTELEKRAAAFHTGPEKLNRLASALKSFQKLSLELVGGIPFKIGSFLTEKVDEINLPIIGMAEKPTFVYAFGGQKVSQLNDIGLQKYGPYSREGFSPSKPRICVICQASKKGQVEQVLRKFLDGIPPVEYAQGKSFEYTGLKAKYYLTGCHIEFFTTIDDSVESYNRATSDAIKAQGLTNQDPWNLALVQIDRTFRDRSDNNNPYLTTKARLIGQQIPVQEFTLEALALPDKKVVWTLNNMSLATYAKLNGVPWLLKADRPIAHEVVFGIGSATIKEGRFGGGERMIGVTTVFTGDGNYFVSNVSSAVPEEEYFATLLDSLRTTMASVKHDLNWQPRDTVRLIFHAFKEFKKAEAEAVKKVMSELGDYQVEFAFVHVAQDHPYLLFDTNKKNGVGFYNKGRLAPDRGQYVQLTKRIMLVSLTGGTELKQATDGLPTPVQLVLHRDSTFKDLTYLAKQVVNFAAHSWRSFQPAPMPVTVFYSQLVAQMLGQLSGVPYWTSDAILNRIGTTRWFL